MNKIIIPNFVTSLNILCGTSAIYVSLSSPDDLHVAAFLVFLASVFDFLDGFLARLLHAQSDFGKQMDSFADLISFGLAPTFIMFKLLQNVSSSNLIPFAAFLIVVMSALRLSTFNITNQKTTFSGMPTPALAIFVASLPLILKFSTDNYLFISKIIHNQYFLLSATVAFSILLVLKVKMISLKFSNLRFKENIARYTLILMSLILAVFFKWVAIPLTIILYIVISLFNNVSNKENITNKN